MKRLIAIALLGCFMLSLFACGPNNNEQITTPDTTTVSDSPSTNPDSELKILFGKNVSYTFVCENGMTGIWDFPQLFEAKTGIKTSLRYALESTGEQEILLGTIEDREASITQGKKISYTGYLIQFVGERLVISANNTEILKNAFAAFLDALEQNEEGEWGIRMDVNLKYDPSPVKDGIPKFDPKSGELEGVYQCYDDNYQVIFKRVGNSAFDDYAEALEDAGYTLYAEHMIGDNVFGTYVTENTTVRVLWFKADKSLRIIYGERTYLPPTKAEAAPIKDLHPTVTQIGRTGATQGAAGMSYIVQLTDGSFVVIDGGPFDQSDTKKLMTYLNANKPTSHEKPRVTWMISHLHSDHVDLSLDFLKKYAEDIDLELFCWGVPDYSTLKLPNESTDNALVYQRTYRKLLAESYPDTPVYNFYTGDQLHLPGCTVEVLCTYNDIWPTALKDINETSAMFRFVFESGKTFLATGDTYPVSCNWTSKVYGEELGSDIVQTPHHGRVGSTAEFYRNVKPAIVLWSNAKRYLDPNYSDNAYSRDHNAEILADKSIQHYHSEFTTIIDMTDLSVAVHEDFIWKDESGEEEKTEGLTFTASQKHLLSKHLAKAPLTIEAVISLPQEVSGRGGVIMGNYKASGGQCYGIEIFNNGVPRLYLITSAKKTVDVKFTEVDIRSDGFVLLSIVLDVANAKALCYVDGELKQSVSVSLSGELTYPELHMIGGDHREGNSQYFKGVIQSVVAYSDVRTAAEIEESMVKMDVDDPDILVAYFFLNTDTPLEDLSPNQNDIEVSKG